MALVNGAMGLGIILRVRDEASRQLGRIRGQIRSTEDASANLVAAFDAIGDSAMGLGAVALVGAGIFTLVSGVNDLQSALAAVQMKTGAADAEMAGFRDTMLDIYGQGLGEDFTDIGNTIGTLRQITGQTGDELKNAASGALLVRDAFDIDITESARAVDSMMKHFGLSADQAYTLIAQGAQNGANKNGDLADSLNEYAIHFQQLGFSGEEFTDILIAGAQSGAFSIDKVGDAFKEFGIRVKDGSKGTAEGFEAIGLDAEDMTQKFTAGGEVAQDAFYETVDALMGLEDPVARNQAGVALWGTMWEDLGEEGIRALMKVSGKADMTADTLAQIKVAKLSSFGEAFGFMGRQIEVAFLGPLSEMAMPLLKDFISFVLANSETIKSVAVPAILGIGTAIAGIGIVAAMPFLGPAVAAVGAFIVAVGWIPIAIGAVVAAGIWLYQNWEQVVAFLENSCPSLVEGFHAVWNALSEGFAFIMGVIDLFQRMYNAFGWDGVIMAAKAVFGDLGEMVATYAGEIVDGFGSIFTGIMQLFSGDFTGGIGSIFSGVSMLFSAGFTFLTDLTAYALGFILTTVINAGMAFVMSVGEWLSQSYETVTGWLSSMILAVPGFLDQLPGIAASAGAAFLTAVSDWAQGAYDAVSEWISQIPSLVSEAFSAATESVGNWWDGVKSKFSAGTAAAGGEIPKHATGGIFDSPHIAWVCEEGPEAIVPLDGSRNALNIWRQTGQMLGVLPKEQSENGVNSITDEWQSVSMPMFRMEDMPQAMDALSNLISIAPMKADEGRAVVNGAPRVMPTMMQTLTERFTTSREINTVEKAADSKQNPALIENVVYLDGEQIYNSVKRHDRYDKLREGDDSAE